MEERRDRAVESNEDVILAQAMRAVLDSWIQLFRAAIGPDDDSATKDLA
jgi:hypothetical protein